MFRCWLAWQHRSSWLQHVLGLLVRARRVLVTMLGDVRGLPLDEYSRSVPPGWKPHLNSYPLKDYNDKLKLWLRMTDIETVQVGPTLVGRLKGAA